MDVFTRKRRSQVMSAIRSSGNRDTELLLAKIFRAFHITGWRRKSNLLGRPDFVFREARVAVFVDGCFWHGCPKHGRMPDTHRDYWFPKLERNRRRDRRVTTALRRDGWRVVRIWEHCLKEPERVANRCLRVISTSSD